MPTLLEKGYLSRFNDLKHADVEGVKHYCFVGVSPTACGLNTLGKRRRRLPGTRHHYTSISHIVNRNASHGPVRHRRFMQDAT